MVEDSTNYVELDFGPKKSKTNHPLEEDRGIILPPPRLHHHHHHQNNHQQLRKITVPELSSAPTPAINHHLHIHHPPPTNPRSTTSNNPITSSTTAIRKHQTTDTPQQEDPRDFATFLCIFASVMTTVLVLMFYMVGEQAFRLILLVISFVSILTLCLACFLRRPTLVILGQTLSNHTGTDDTGQWSSNHVANKIPFETQQKSPQPYLLIFPTLFGQQPVHSDPTHTMP